MDSHFAYQRSTKSPLAEETNQDDREDSGIEEEFYELINDISYIDEDLVKTSTQLTVIQCKLSTQKVEGDWHRPRTIHTYTKIGVRLKN